MAIRIVAASQPTETHVVFWASPMEPKGPWANETRLGASADDARAEIEDKIDDDWGVERVVRMDLATGACADVTKQIARALWLAADWVEQRNAREIDGFVTGFGFPSALAEYERACAMPYRGGSINGRSHDGARL